MAKTTHGMCTMRIYNIWRNMLRRCKNPKYPNYGGRGITVCDRWKTFEGFFADMGSSYKDGLTIDRYPLNDGNYEPGNCRWATYAEQRRNCRSTHLLTFEGVTLCLTDWAKKVGVSPKLLECRINKHNWSAERALTTPARSFYWRDAA